MRNIFTEKLYIKYCGVAIPRLFSKKSKLSIIVLKLKSRYLETKLPTTSFYPLESFFWKKSKNMSATSLPALFSAILKKIKNSQVISY